MALRISLDWRHLRRATSLVALGVLTACGGGGGGDPTSDPAIPGPTQATDDTPRTVSGMRDAANDLLDVWAPNGAPTYTRLATVPSTGTASYDGFVFGDLSNGAVIASLIGQLSLNADFSATDVVFAGSATDFVDQVDAPLSGSLTVTGGDFNRDGNPASDATLRGISVAGTLRDGSGTVLEVGLQLEGDFLGTSVGAVGGEAIGRVTSGATTLDFDGGFIASED